VQLQESGVDLDSIQLGRAEGDDETFLDVLDAETEDLWMRNPQVPEYVEELLGGDGSVAGEASRRQPSTAADMQQQPQQGQRAQ
jgi:hypothetical protein